MTSPLDYDDPLRGGSVAALARVEALLPRIGLRQTKPSTEILMGCGFGVGWQSGGFAGVSVGAGNEGHVHVLSGALADVEQDRPRLVDQCNRWNQNLAAYPVYLHDAQQGWDVLVHTSFPLELIENNPAFLHHMLGTLPQIAERVRGEFDGFGGRPYAWSEEDLVRLLQRSLL